LAAIAARNAAAAAGARFAGRRAVVVGGTSGIGRGAAAALARAGFAVTVVGRSAARGAEVLRELGAASAAAAAATGAPPAPPHAFVACDASLIGGCYAAAARILEELAAGADAPALDVLFMSQGIATTRGLTPTAEGVDEKLALHAFSRLAFADALLPALLRSATPRLVSVLSGGVHARAAAAYAALLAPPPGGGLLLAAPGAYSLKRAADAAGLLNDVFVDELGRRRLGAVHAAPGFVRTSWGTELPPLLRGAVRLLQALPLGRGAGEAGEAMVAPAVAAARPGDALAEVAGAGRPGALVMDADARPVAGGAGGGGFTEAHEAARAALWPAALALLARLRPEGATSGLHA